MVSVSMNMCFNDYFIISHTMLSLLLLGQDHLQTKIYLVTGVFSQTEVQDII